VPEFSESGLRSFEGNFYPDGPLTATESTTRMSKLFCLQVGIFRSANAAAAVQHTMDELGFAPVRRKAEVFQEDTAYRVEIGPLASDEEITHYQQALKKLDYDSFRITCSEDS
jgi:cell division protein FtsN